MDETLETVPAAPPVAQTPFAQAPRVISQPAHPSAIWIPRIVICLLLLVASVFAWRQGVRLRHWMWDTTVPIRYAGDIDRDFRWGRLAAREGYLNQYEKMQFQKPDDSEWLDQPPLRLAIMTLWGRWSLDHFPKVEKWSSNHSFGLTAPLLRFDLLMEVIALMAVFFLTRLWAVRGRLVTPVLSYPPDLDPAAVTTPGASTRLSAVDMEIEDKNTVRWFFRGCIPAAVAALILWFNPAVILSAYAWPAWDLWLIPIFLLAACMASMECWFTAGIIVGIGAMLDQHMVVAIPLFLLWNIILHGWPRWPLPTIPTAAIAVATAVMLTVLNLMLTSFHCVSAAMLLFAEAVVVVALVVCGSLIRHPLRPLRFASGLVLAIAIIASPWLLSYIPPDKLDAARAVQKTFGQPAKVPLDVFRITRAIDVPAVLWVIGVLAAAVGLPFVTWLTLEAPTNTTGRVPRWRRVLASQWAWRGLAAFGAIVLVMWPWLIKRNHADCIMGLRAAAAMIVAIHLVRPRGIAMLGAASVAIALLLCMSVFHGSTAWYDCGFHFQAIHYPWMSLGMADNLPAIMVRDFNWHRLELSETAFTIPAHFLLRYPLTATDVSTGAALQTLFWATLLLCSLGAGMHARRRSARLLTALAAIWLMLFCFAPQMHERYLLFAAGISCICAGTSVGMTLLGMFLSLAASVMMLNNLLANAANDRQLGEFSKGLAEQFPNYCSVHTGRHLLDALNGANPDLGYAVVLCGLVFLYFSLAPQNRSKFQSL
jgi:hypothetical protein